MYYTYILESLKNHRFYIGHCENVEARVAEHNAGMTRSTKPYRPWKLVYAETYETRSEASRREHEIKKKKRRSYIENLIGQYSHHNVTRYGPDQIKIKTGFTKPVF